MKLYTGDQLREADRRAIAEGVASAHLMESAGAAVTWRLQDLFPAASAVLVLCGKGNNGGDGYVAARLLLRGGPPLTVLELSDTPATPDAAAARAALLAAGGEPAPLTREALDTWVARHCGDRGAAIGAVMIDALLGSGLDRPVQGELAELVEAINDSACRVLAIDVPTGIDADRATSIGPHVRADATVQLAGPTVASYFHPARAAFARGDEARERAEFVADIGIPQAILDELSQVTVLDVRTARAWLPERPPTVHKYSAGTVTVVAGSERYLGAAELACRGAWRGGAGLVTLVAAGRLPSAWPETILLPLTGAETDEAPDAVAQAADADAADTDAAAADAAGDTDGDAAHPAGGAWPPPGLEPRHARACVVGPGLDAGALDALPAILAWAPGALVLDAAALQPEALWRALGGQSRGGEEDPSRPLVLTPHAAEAARLLSHRGEPVSAGDVAADPLGCARRLADAARATVVLKGPTTVIARPGGEAAVCSRGHAGMASGGTGDVLAGLLGALLAAPASPEAGDEPDEPGSESPDEAAGTDAGAAARTAFERACLAVFVHGVAGERAAERLGNALIASDVVAEIGPTLVGLGWD